MTHDGFVFYRSFFEALAFLPDAERLAAYEAICRYGLNGEVPETGGIVASVFTLIKPQIDANNKRREAGRKGSQALSKQTASKQEANESKQEANESKQEANESKNKQTEANSKQVEAKEKDKVKEKEKVKDKVKEKDKEIKEKVNQKESGLAPYGLSSDLEAEVKNFIAARKQMRKPMTDRAIELFIKRVQSLGNSDAERIAMIQTAIERGWQTVYPPKDEKPKATKPNRFNAFEQRSYDYDALEADLIGLGGAR